jgi:hypothetical protein
MEVKFKIMDITHRSPSWYSTIYLVNVIIFSIVYWFFFSGDFGPAQSLSYIASFYFSVVTVTTLGYGDITPNLDSNFLLITIITQVVFGVITIGLFLNSLSQKLSDIKDTERKIEEERKEAVNLVKLLTILRPTIVTYLAILSESYKVTASDEKGTIKVKPKDLFNRNYYDQISRQNFLSNKTRYGDDVMKFGDFIVIENKKFTDSLNDYLNKFASTLPINVIELVVSLINHRFLTHAEQAINSYKHTGQMGVKFPQMNMLTIEHSSVNIPEKPDSIKDFHDKILSIIGMFDDLLPDVPVEMSIDLRKGVTAPAIGSAIGDIIRFGPFKV